MGLFDRTIIARSPDRVPRAQALAADLLGPADLLPGAALDGFSLSGWEFEGDHLRLDLRRAEAAAGFAVLVRPRDAAAAAFLRSRAWNVGYRGDLAEAAGPPLLTRIAERLDAVAAQLGLDAAGLHARYFARPNQSDYLEISSGKKLYVRLTEECDEACLFCNATEGNANVVPSRRSVEEILRGLPVGDLAQVIFSGGEPTLVKSLPAMVALAYERGAREIILQTNGVFFGTTDGLDAYLPYRDRLGIGFSLHAIDPRLSARMTGSDAARFAAKIRGIDRSIGLGFRSKVTCVVMQPNLAQVPTLAEWLWQRYGRGLTCLQYSYAMPRGNAWRNAELLLRFSECVAPFAAAFDLGRRTGLRVETSQSACVPPCVMPEYIDHYDLYGDFTGRTADPERTKPPEVCGTCRWDGICAGVWKRYLDVFGAAELRAIVDRAVPDVPVQDFREAEVLDLAPE